ncbi:MAG TPA: RagB/SusD family nutrient uptake outer membrane protein [Ferruginibacter sp.]|jgi:hypothetical protein|nr:RagB/SusD family nutrient uptake outer membrane protein [Ferruginibacter sp.]
MYKKIIFSAIVLISIASITSCRKDESNVEPTNNLTSVTYPKTLGDLESFLVPGYSGFRSANLFGYQYLAIVLSSDHTFCSQNSGGNPLSTQGGDFLTNNISVTNTPSAAMFSQLYQGVAAMNVFFDRATYYQNNFGDSTDVNALRGQAYFLRAYYFYMLECFYGEKYIDMTQPEDPTVLGIPLPTTFATSVAQTNLPRSTAYQTWAQIISDLRNSAKYLHGVTYAPSSTQLPGQGQGQITEWAADGMLGKAFVFTKQYDSAKTYLLKVINDGVHSLPSFNVYSNSFNGDIANKFNTESLFEINVDRQAQNPGILFSGNYLQSLTTDQGELFAPTIIGSAGVDSLGNGDGNAGSSVNMGNGYCKYFVHDKNLRRFGFALPVYTYDRNPNAIGINSAASPTFIMDSVSWKNSLADRINNTVDPRLFVCAMEPWIDSCEQPSLANSLPSGGTPQEFPDTIPVGKAAIINTTRSSFWGWSFKKYTTTTDILEATGGNDGSNLLLLRLADVYLLYAEACEATGDNGTALTYINKVHERAYNGSTAFDYTTITSPTLADPTDVDLANNPLHYERYVELFGEGGWWFDMCRWGIGANEAAYYVYGATEYDPIAGTGPANSLISTANWTGNGTDSKAYHFPIPQVETSTNPAIQHNNFGY